jgi:hypothetical protein
MRPKSGGFIPNTEADVDFQAGAIRRNNKSEFKCGALASVTCNICAKKAAHNLLTLAHVATYSVPAREKDVLV